jgi:hypothetical protein
MMIYSTQYTMSMLFCPTCNNMLDISKNAPTNNKVYDNLTPNTVSATSDSDNESNIIEKLIQKYLDGEETLTVLDIKSLNFDIISRHEKYKQMNNTQKKKFKEILASLTQQVDASISAYYRCTNCGFSDAIAPGTLITSRAREGLTSNFVNIDKYKNMIYNKALPHTRNYICTSKTCASHKEPEKREAVFYRNGMQVWYTCMECQSYWKGE